MSHHSPYRRWDRRSLRDRELPLFTPPANGTATSQAAAASVAPHTHSLRWCVLTFIRERGSEGAISEQIARALNVKESTTTARVNELCKGGLVHDSGRTRPTSTRRQATVWIAT